MKAVLAVVAILSCIFIIPTSAIYCHTCSNCGSSGSVITNSSCGSQDTCVKYDFGDSAIHKLCGTSSSHCTSAGFKANSGTLYSQMINLMNQITVDAELAINLNSKARKVINCCSDKDYCNNGMQATISLMAILGMTLAYILA